MKTIITVTLISFFLIASSCHEEEIPEVQTNADGVVIALPYQWKKTLHHSGNFESNSQMKTKIQYNGNIGVPTTDGTNNRFLSMLDSKTGETLWRWNDMFTANDYIYINFKCQHNNLLTYQSGKKSYCINLENGSTHWKAQRNKEFGIRLFPNNDNSFFCKTRKTNANGHTEGGAYLCNYETGEYEEFVTPNLSGEYVNPRNSIGGVNNISKLPNSDYLYAVSYTEPAPDWVNIPYFGLYNSNTQEWEYERVPMIEIPTYNSDVYHPAIYDNKFYAMVGKNLACHDLETGEQLWIRQFTQDFSFSGFIIEEGIIIANNEDTYTYGINPDDGTILWQEQSAGTSGYMSYLNGYVYFVGGSTGKLHAIEVSTGKTVWQIDAHKIGEEDGSLFNTNAVYVFPAEGGQPARVIASSFKNVYSFKAYQ